MDVQAEIYPKDIELTLIPQFCKILDQKDDGKQSFLIGRVQASLHKYENRKHEIIIFGSRFMINLLISSTKWYIDATFCIFSPGFYQMLNIILYNKTTQMHFPALYVLITGKKEFLYDILLNYLRIYADFKKDFI